MARTYVVILLVGISVITGFAQVDNSPNRNLDLPPVNLVQDQAQGEQQPSDKMQAPGEGGSRDSKPSENKSNSDRQTTVSVGQLKLSGKARGALYKAWVAIGKEKVTDAARYVEKALAFCPRSAEALTFRAALKAQDINSRQEAKTDAEKAVEYDPNYGGGYIILGSIYSSLGQYDDAIRTLDRGIVLLPTNWAGYYEMSIALLGKQDFIGGLRQAEKASRLGPQNFPGLHLVKAYAYIGLRNRSAAVAELDALQKLDPNSPLLVRAKKTFDNMLPVDRDSRVELRP